MFFERRFKTLKSLKMHSVKSFLFLSKFLWTQDSNLDHLESTLLTKSQRCSFKSLYLPDKLNE